MKLGIAVRSMGPQSEPQVFLTCVRAAEAAGFDDVWIQDHIAIPPDDAEGSDGRYLDPLTALAWVGGQTRRIGLGTGVLILPYRPALPTAKAIATVQELCAGRLQLGVGVGWMDPEFRALGVARRRRGALTDDALELLRRCFAQDVVVTNDQPFLFRPRPPRPPIYVGGTGDHALARAVRHGDGWMPMMLPPEKLTPATATLRAMAEEAEVHSPEVVLFTGFDPREPGGAADQAAALAEAGATRFIAGTRYADADEFQRAIDFLAAHVLPAVRQLG
jgi:probable F420-dependent oxidoreductase